MKRLSPEVLAILETGLIVNEQHRSVVIRDQLPRKLYEGVNSVLAECGGKWNKGVKAHLFTLDPWERLAEIIEAGGFIPNRSAYQAFYTPAGLAERLVELADIREGHDVLEPSAGQGALLRAIEETGRSLTRLVAVELDPKQLPALRDITAPIAGKPEVVNGDFLVEAPALGKFDRVVMNPPFANHADIRHVTQAWALLKPGGRLAAITGPSWRYRTNKEHAAFRDFATRHLVGGVEEIPAGAFKESGTDVRTLMFALAKP
jgi:predicted RNA methylase